jgi:manganese transport protein
LVDTAIAAKQALSGERRGLRAVMPFLGPAFIACVAYVDPGNFATNVAGGAQFGYALGWVVLTANLMAMLVQTRPPSSASPPVCPCPRCAGSGCRAAW